MNRDHLLETEGLTEEFRGCVAVNGVNLLTHVLTPTRGRIFFVVCVLTFRRGVVGGLARILRKPL